MKIVIIDEYIYTSIERVLTDYTKVLQKNASYFAEMYAKINAATATEEERKAAESHKSNMLVLYTECENIRNLKKAFEIGAC